jgi:hypothetical protein
MFLLPLAMAAQVRQDVAPLKNWPAPLYWQPTAEEQSLAAKNEISGNNAAEVTPLAQTPVNSLVFVGMTPCRLVDTRSAAGFTGAFGPPSLVANATRSFPLQASTTCTVPSIAQAYSLNVTVVPPGYLGYLTIWPYGATRPSASTLNDYLGTVVANAAIVPAGNDVGSGSVNVFVNDPTDLVIDINGYYAPQSGITLTQGTAAAPSLSFAGDDGTGIYSSGTGTVNIATGGTNSLVVQPNGNVEVTGNAQVDGGSILASGSVPVIQFPTNGSNNFSAGFGALPPTTTGTEDTAVGDGALSANTTGYHSLAIGYEALGSNTTGFNNTAVGYDALISNTTGADNTANGSEALLINTTGALNTATGAYALSYNTTGTEDTALGYIALYSNSTGGANTALGSSALQNSTTGNFNIAIGTYAGLNVTTGSNNIDIGNEGTASDSGTIRIGCTSYCPPGLATPQTSAYIAGIYGVTTSASNAVPVLIDSNGNLGTISSSRRYKEDIQDMADASSGLMRLRPVTFRYKKAFDDGSKPVQYGLIAEEVAEVYPDLVARSADGQIETVKYQVLDSLLLNELQKQNATIAAQKEQIRSLEERLARVEAALSGTTVTAWSR